MKNIMLITVALFSLQLNGAASGFRSSMQAGRQLVTGLRQPTQRFMATQTPKFTGQSGKWSNFKNMFAGTPRQFSNAWAQYRKPVALGALGLGGAGLAYKTAMVEEEQTAHSSKNCPFTFDREHMIVLGDNRKSEDVWSSCGSGKYDQYPAPKANTEPWPTQNLFLQRLAKIEKKADLETEQKDFLSTFKKIEAQAKKFGYTLNLQNNSGADSNYHIDNWRCLATSRFDPNEHVSMKSYIYTDKQTGQTISWTGAFGHYYVKKFNVKPSQEFYDWVMNNPDGN